MDNSPLIRPRPYFLGGGTLGGGWLTSHDLRSKEQWSDEQLAGVAGALGTGMMAWWCAVLKKTTCEQWKKGPWLFTVYTVGDEILPNYMGIIVNHYKDPY